MNGSFALCRGVKESTCIEPLISRHLKEQPISTLEYPKVSYNWAYIYNMYIDDDPLPDVKHYYTRHMPCVPSQPPDKRDLSSSLLEKNASEFAAQQEWEAEWNQLGLASRLSEEVRWANAMCVKQHIFACRIIEHVRSRDCERSWWTN